MGMLVPATQESYTPRASDRTMVGNAATVTLVSFGSRFGRSRLQDHPAEGAYRTASHREATRNSTSMQGGWMSRHMLPTVDRGRSISLDIPSNRTFRHHQSFRAC